jgi:hypothetical protein
MTSWVAANRNSLGVVEPRAPQRALALLWYMVMWHLSADEGRANDVGEDLGDHSSAAAQALVRRREGKNPPRREHGGSAATIRGVSFGLEAGHLDPIDLADPFRRVDRARMPAWAKVAFGTDTPARSSRHRRSLLTAESHAPESPTDPGARPADRQSAL